MTQVMTPSGEVLTNGQIAKICDLLAAGLRKAGLQSEPTQQAIETQGGPLVDELIGVIRKRVEASSQMIVRSKAKVNRGRSQQEAIEATGRAQYTDREVVDAMPKVDSPAGEDKVEVVFFKPDLSNRNGYISDDDLEKEFDLRGLKPADPISVAAVNEADPAFADEKPHGTHWKDAKGNWCYATFRRWDDERRVVVYRSDGGWDDGWWFAGVRK